MECRHPISTLAIHALSGDGIAVGKCGACGEQVRVQYSMTWDDELDPLVTDMIEQEKRGELPAEDDFKDIDP